MSNIDVRDLQKETLKKTAFPGSVRSDLRFYLAPEVHQGIWEHGQADTSVEVCGVLVGSWEEDDQGPFARVTNYIRSSSAASKHAEVTFTHDSWTEINQKMDADYTDKRIVGWYHTHPDFGIFLSDRDVFIHEHFFYGPGQVAYVIDPVRQLEGVFSWQDGKPKPMAHYWVGERICTVEASQSSSMDSATPEKNPPQQQVVHQSPEASLTMLLSWVALFLLGYVLASTLANWDKRLNTMGAVAHFGTHKLMRYGLDQELNSVRSNLAIVGKQYTSLPVPKEMSKDQQLAHSAVIKNLKRISDQVLAIEQRYCYSDDEKRVLQQLIASKIAEVEPSQSRDTKPIAEQEKPAETKDKEAKPNDVVETSQG